jgi:hypothetical protein
MWCGTGALLAATICVGITSVALHWPAIPFNFGILLTLLLGIPSAGETLRAKRHRNSALALDRFEKQSIAG